MQKYNIIATKPFLRDLRRINKNIGDDFARKIEEEIEKLEQNPCTGKKLKGLDVGIWRIRIGDYRLRYDIIDKEVVLHAIKHRKDIYK